LISSGMSMGKVLLMWGLTLVALMVWAWFTLNWAGLVLELEDARTWPTVQGTVTDQRITEVIGANGRRSYRPEVRYSYVARDGQLRVGYRVHRGIEPDKSRSWAQARLSGFPVGKSVPVYVDPGDPGVSLLEPGIGADEWREACLLVALGLVVVAMLANALHLVRRRGRGYVAGVRIIPGPPVWCRQESCGALAGSLYAGAVVAVVVGALAHVLDGGSVLWVLGTLAAGLGVAVPVWLVQRALPDRPASGDLVLDYDKEVVVTPKVFESESSTVPMAEVVDLVILAVTRGSGRSRTTTQQVHLVLSDGGEREVGPIAMGFSSVGTAREFAKWLAGELALEPG